MSEQYTHTLIPVPNHFKPTAEQVQAFLEQMIKLGAVEGTLSLTGRTLSKQVRTATNPFTGEKITIPMRDRFAIPSVSKVAEAIAGLGDYSVALSGTGVPKTPPVPLEFTEPYHVGITCRNSRTLCSTSDLHLDEAWHQAPAAYGAPSHEERETGFFTNPHTGETVEVAHAGCASFWIEFELGKFLFPKIDVGDLEILNPVVVGKAVAIFGVHFVQGCVWG